MSIWKWIISLTREVWQQVPVLPSLCPAAHHSLAPLAVGKCLLFVSPLSFVQVSFTSFHLLFCCSLLLYAKSQIVSFLWKTWKTMMCFSGSYGRPSTQLVDRCCDRGCTEIKDIVFFRVYVLYSI